MLNFEETDELLYTDEEVRQQMIEAIGRPRVRTNRRPGRTVPFAKPHGNPAMQETHEGDEEDLCWDLPGHNQWPALARASSEDQSVWRRS
jgi:hypothetical protein